jgi:dolichol-phosphate mannosyltransferase
MPRKISFVLPTYNERENIVKLIEKIQTVSKKHNFNIEIIVIDDNSPDGTANVVKELNKKYNNIRLFIRERKLGIATAHLLGYKKARGDIIISMDSDLSHDPASIPQFIQKINEGYDIVVGSRHIKGSYYEKKALNTKIKYFLSKFGNILSTLISHVPVHDFTNGYRAFRKKVSDNIQIESTGNSFLMEFIVKAYRKGYKITEIPVTFFDRRFGKSKIKHGKESIRYFFKLFKYSR